MEVGVVEGVVVARGGTVDVRDGIGIGVWVAVWVAVCVGGTNGSNSRVGMMLSRMAVGRCSRVAMAT